MIPFQSFGNRLRWTFENISTLNKEERFSDVFLIGQTSWKIAISKNSWVSLHLHYDSENKNEKNWLCEPEAVFKVLRQRGNGKHMEDRYSYALNSSKRKLGDLSLGADDFIVNGSIIIEIDLNVVYHDFSQKIYSYTDIIVNVENTEFHLNKGALCAKSKYFYDLFVAQKAIETAVTLDNITAQDFCYILIPFNPFLNTIKENTYENLIKIANDYGVQSLHYLCEQYLLTQNYPWKTIQNIKIADENGYELLMKKSIECLKSIEDLRNVQANPIFSELKETTKLRVMMRCLDFV